NPLKGKTGIIAGLISDTEIMGQFVSSEEANSIEEEGFLIKSVNGNVILASKGDKGLLYASFRLLQEIQQFTPLAQLYIAENPSTKVRVLNHWDNLDRTVERGYAGFSIWNWHELPTVIDQRYIDYARANASIGINGTVVTNVNSNALIFRADYIQKAKALADVFRPYGIRLYLTARFSAPIEAGGLSTANPKDIQVQQWWDSKVKEIYQAIPDFGGFLVKANSEGQPGPQDYGCTHADGANMLADALAPFGGLVMWRAFVYSHEELVDRAKQAYDEFMPLDGQFRDNVLVQVKNGPIDFQPREPIHPLFGAMKKTPLMMEFQITKEYLGQGTHLVGLANMYEEVLKTDTYHQGKGSTVAKVIDGQMYGHQLSGMAGVANIGTARNWTGNLFAQADWFAFGRLAWNTERTAQSIFEEWSTLTFATNQNAKRTAIDLLSQSHEACVNYMTPMGLHHIMATDHHYGPGPWVDNLSRADWNPVYYHRADKRGIGFDRTPTGSDALSQYSDEFIKQIEDLNTCPDKFLLWFHHLPWDYKMKSGITLWEELCKHYQTGVTETERMLAKWQKLEGEIDAEQYNSVEQHLRIQTDEAIWWRDACLSYFQTFSGFAIPSDIPKPAHNLDYYKAIKYPYAPGISPKW
ncbi:MAG: alpha-glucuronidase, partial [Bacteroidales bacterium]|nr:alpha-glucuronidase [Bacteroidales bacterium]